MRLLSLTFVLFTAAAVGPARALQAAEAVQITKDLADCAAYYKSKALAPDTKNVSGVQQMSIENAKQSAFAARRLGMEETELQRVIASAFPKYEEFRKKDDYLSDEIFAVGMRCGRLLSQYSNEQDFQQATGRAAKPSSKPKTPQPRCDTSRLAFLSGYLDEASKLSRSERATLWELAKGYASRAQQHGLGQAELSAEIARGVEAAKADLDQGPAQLEMRKNRAVHDGTLMSFNECM